MTDEWDHVQINPGDLISLCSVQFSSVLINPAFRHFMLTCNPNRKQQQARLIIQYEVALVIAIVHNDDWLWSPNRVFLLTSTGPLWWIPSRHSHPKVLCHG